MSISPVSRQLLDLLADGRFHSGTELAATVAVSRSAVWKHLQALADLGLELVAVSGKGYKLSRPLQLLNRKLIEQSLDRATLARLQGIEIFDVIASTNSYLLEAAHHDRGSGCVCLAEYQSAGKGRRGKTWVSPFGHNIYLSILWHYQNGPASIAGLSLAVGLALAKALRQVGIEDVGLKWPNDIYWHGRKLAGILIEVSGESGGPCHAVVGLGLNLYLPELQGQGIDQAWTDLTQILGGDAPIERNRLVASLLNALLPVLAEFETSTLAAYLAEWRHFDCMYGKPAAVSVGEQLFQGIVRGVDEQGMLLLEQGDGQLRRFASGEVTLKAA